LEREGVEDLRGDLAEDIAREIKELATSGH
jgi:hypothetical protein